MGDLFLGIDIGSTTVKVVLLDQQRHVRGHIYRRSNGQSHIALLHALREAEQTFAWEQIAGVGLTGSGGERIAQVLGGQHVNELIAQTRAVSEYYPQARTVIEIGGQDSKFLSLAWDAQQGQLHLQDFAMNAICAAGTGSFLDQQAERLGIAIEDEFAYLALQAEHPARIAGRCTVFAKSDMIHLQQKGTPLPDILAGLCLALARNFKGVISKNKTFTPPIVFQGGVAANQAVVRAFETVLGLQPGDLIIPEQHHVMAAIGTALLAQEAAARGELPTFQGWAALEELVHTEQSNHRPLPALTTSSFPLPTYHHQPLDGASIRAAAAPLPVYLGIDVGSVSTNVVLLDAHGHVVARRYVPTAGKPLDAVRTSLHSIGDEVGAQVVVEGVGVTGSGRYLTSEFVGGDLVRNEITAQARAATALDPTVDTIFEIGGQDSKYIRLDRGTVVDFTMNSACAAGTGSFLEEQAERLDINIQADFSRLALRAQQPTGLGDRCTVFMESDIVHHQQQGAGLDQLTAGLAYAIAQNYLNRVVNNRPIGQKIFFQGGVAWNQSVVAAFQTLLNRPLIVPPHHDVTGAIGVAILAMENLTQRRTAGEVVVSRFKGFDLHDRHYETTTFECHACPNICDVSKVTIAGELPIFYGARCDMFEEFGQLQARRRQIDRVPDLFAERSALLLGDYQAPAVPRSGRPRVALPRAMTFHDLFPYWRTLFKALDIELVLSEPTNPAIVKSSLEHAGAETCFPAKLVYGHVLSLRDQDLDVDAIIVPSMINREDGGPGQRDANYCPFVSASAYLLQAHVDTRTRSGVPIIPLPFNLRSQQERRDQLRGLLAELGIVDADIDAADAAAFAELQAFNAAIRRRGDAILAGLDGSQPAVVLVGRPYNTADRGVCQDLPHTLRKLGILPIPIDFLPTNRVDISPHYPDICSPSGQSVLAAGLIIREHPHLQAIYVTNFCCGPDAFFLGFFRRILGDKPFLELELDEHTADAGLVTRCEAFFDSLRIGHRVLV